MFELEGDQGGFEGAHQQHRQRDGDDGPEYDVHPERGFQVEFHPERGADDDGTNDQDQQGGGTVAGVDGAQVEIAGGAGITNGQNTPVKGRLTAAWASAGETRLPPCGIGHSPAMTPCPHGHDLAMLTPLL